MAKKNRSTNSKSAGLPTSNSSRVKSAKASQRSKVAETLGEGYSESYMEASAYAGPVPAPDDLAQYETLLPGSADRLISMAERESAHRQEIEKTLAEAAVRDRGRDQDYLDRGQKFAFILAISAIGAGVYLASTGTPEWGAMLGLSGVAVLIWPFINRFNRREKD